MREISVYRKLAKRLQKCVPELAPGPVAHNGAAAAINPGVMPSTFSVGMLLTPSVHEHVWQRDGHWRATLLFIPDNDDDLVQGGVKIGPPVSADPIPFALWRAMGYFGRWRRENPGLFGLDDEGDQPITFEVVRIEDIERKIRSLGLDLNPTW